jgi:hypothetical protein
VLLGQLLLTSQFLFLHPDIKKRIDFESESMVISYVKFYRKNDLKKKLVEMNGAYEALNLSDKDMESTETEVLYFLKITNKY